MELTAFIEWTGRMTSIRRREIVRLTRFTNHKLGGGGDSLLTLLKQGLLRVVENVEEPELLLLCCRVDYKLKVKERNQIVLSGTINLRPTTSRL